MERTLMNIKLSSGETLVFPGDKKDLAIWLNEGGLRDCFEKRGHSPKTGPLLDKIPYKVPAQAISYACVIWPHEGE